MQKAEADRFLSALHDIEIATNLSGGRMEETKELITTDDIRSKVYIIRGQQVMLDKDLAEIYGYEVKKLVLC